MYCHAQKNKRRRQQSIHFETQREIATVQEETIVVVPLGAAAGRAERNSVQAWTKRATCLP